MSKTNLPRVRNSANYHLFPKKFEVNNDPSETVPNQSMTVLEMIARHARGLPVDGTRNIPLFEGEDVLPDISNMDLAEQQEVIEAVADKLADIKTKLAAEKRSADQQKEVDRIDKEVEKRLQAIRNASKLSGSQPAPSAGNSDTGSK